MTKAATVGERNRRKLRKAASVCPITGEVLSPPRRLKGGARPKESAQEARETAERNICARMGWAWNDANRARCRDQRIGTLYGKLAIVGRIDDDCFDAIEAWERLDNAYRREVMGQPISAVDFRTHDGEARDVTAIKQAHAEAWAILSRDQRDAQLVVAILGQPDAWPSEWPEGYDARLRLVGRALARHFGLRP